MTSTNKTSAFLLSVLSNALFSASLSLDFSAIDLHELFCEAREQAVAAIVFDQIPSEVAVQNAETYSKWQNYALKSVQQNITQLAANAEIESLFRNASIPFCTIKGFACAYYYPDASLRQMGDIDFIIPRGCFEDGIRLMAREGFVCTEERGIHDFHVGFHKDGNLYEMHERVTTMVDAEGYIDAYLENVTSETESVDFGFVQIEIPEHFAHGLIMLLHMQRHMLSGGGIGLRHLCDWAVFSNAFSDEKWCAVFEEKLKKVHLWEFAKACSKTACLYLHMPEKEWFSDFSCELAELLLNDIIIAGNFGHKDIKRYQELVFVSRDINHQTGGVAALNGYINKVYSWRPVFKKYRILLPFGMIIYPIRILFLVLIGKKKVALLDNYKSGHKRNSLYAELFKKD